MRSYHNPFGIPEDARLPREIIRDHTQRCFAERSIANTIGRMWNEDLFPGNGASLRKMLEGIYGSTLHSPSASGVIWRAARDLLGLDVFPGGPVLDCELVWFPSSQDIFWEALQPTIKQWSGGAGQIIRKRAR
jgi:hypothetical protein